jgi:hypothetical protein
MHIESAHYFQSVARWVTRSAFAIFLSFASLLLPLLLPLGASAQGLESIMAPGKLIQGHAKYEDDCKQCHVKLDRKAQDGLCMACHKDIGGDVKSHRGFHGRLEQPVVCRTCHTDHKGRDRNTTEFDHAKFEHNLRANYALKGKHAGAACEKCHVAGKKWREAPQDCVACHRKDDKHKGSLGAKCADCHAESAWKDVKFDHDSTRFPLTGKHSDVKCGDCHRDNVYKDTPKTCVACHRKVDDQKGHKGLFGDKCDACHVTKAWKPSVFNHDTDTKYLLKGKHRMTVCKDCHTGNLYKEKLSQECYSCHKKDDKHKETLGRNCDSCHSEKSWKESPKFDHAKTQFPLLGKHANADCKDCHKSTLFREAPKDCYSCHQKDDKHRGNLGKNCTECHAEQGWKATEGRFQHDKTQFPLRNAHAKPAVQCAACHKDLQSMRGTPLSCVACHKKDDKHETQLGDRCERCHNDQSWKKTSFDHARSRFPLTGRHQIAECKSCHTNWRYRDAPRDCLACHKKDDKHQQTLGARCENCHNTRAWALWSFDHDTRTTYKLEGLHAKVSCDQCHKAPAPAGKDAAPLVTTCIACHRAKDVHGGGFGQRCELCHQVTGWKKVKSRAALPADDASAVPASKPGGEK